MISKTESLARGMAKHIYENYWNRLTKDFVGLRRDVDDIFNGSKAKRFDRIVSVTQKRIGPYLVMSSITPDVAHFFYLTPTTDRFGGYNATCNVVDRDKRAGCTVKNYYAPILLTRHAVERLLFRTDAPADLAFVAREMSTIVATALMTDRRCVDLVEEAGGKIEGVLVRTEHGAAIMNIEILDDGMTFITILTWISEHQIRPDQRDLMIDFSAWSSERESVRATDMQSAAD